MALAAVWLPGPKGRRAVPASAMARGMAVDFQPWYAGTFTPWLGPGTSNSPDMVITSFNIYAGWPQQAGFALTSFG